MDGALARDPEDRPRASALASDLRSALRAAPERRRRPPAKSTPTVRDVLRPLAVPSAGRVAAVGLAAATALLGATLLPFWPGVLVAAIVAGAALGTLLDARIGLGIALAAPLFPIGNASLGAAVLYGAFALALLALGWRDARAGLVFVSGPLLAPLGLLALVPLAVQPARGPVRRAAQAAVAVLAATLVAWIAGEGLPPTGEAAPETGIVPVDGPAEVASALTQALSASPAVLAAAGFAALAAAVLPLARRLSRYGVLAVGAALLVGLVAAGAGIVSVLLVALCWGVAGAVAAGARG